MGCDPVHESYLEVWTEYFLSIQIRYRQYMQCRLIPLDIGVSLTIPLSLFRKLCKN